MSFSLLLSGTEKEEENVGQYILEHLKDHHEWHLPFGIHIDLPVYKLSILGMQLDLSITLHVLMMWIASLLLIVLFGASFRKRQLVPKGIAAILESMVLFVRDEIAVPNMGEKLGKKLTPFLSTLFFFILACNLLGLIPLLSTATGNIMVTAALAIVTFIITQLHGIRHNGLLGYLKHLAPAGVPLLLQPLMVLIEFLGLFTKPFALAMRLFANMLAGHAVIFSLLGVIIVLGTVLVSPVSIAFSIAIYLLEIFVGFLQAYIFVMLSALYIGMSAHPEH